MMRLKQILITFLITVIFLILPMQITLAAANNQDLNQTEDYLGGSKKQQDNSSRYRGDYVGQQQDNSSRYRGDYQGNR